MGKCAEKVEQTCKSYPHCYGCNAYRNPTNYDRILNMSIDEMATMFYGIIHERDLHIMEALKDADIEASLVESLPEIHIAYHKQWLESEAEE